MFSPLDILSAFIDGFLPPGDRDSVERVRARFFVIGSGAIAATILAVSTLYAMSPTVGLAEMLPVVSLVIPTLTFPFLLRRGVSLRLLGGLLVVIIQAGLAWSAAMDRGVDDVAFLWLVASPLFAALIGGAPLAVVSVGTAAAGAIGVLALAETGHVFPDLMSPAFARRYHVANLIAAAGMVATFAWLYEGPLLARARALAARLQTSNAALRYELEARREAQATAEAASRAKDVLLANLSHEFRTPLTAVLCALELLEVGASDEDRAVLQSADRGARRLLATLTGVLDLVGTESGATPAIRSVDAAAAAHAAVAGHRDAAAAKGLVIAVDGGTVPAALADADTLRRLLGLLLDNAVRFTETGGVRVRVTDGADTVVVAVTDTGIGMDASFLDRAAEPFAQASEGETRTHEGLGLGLALAQRLARSMGGTLTIASELGEGTTVSVELPAAPAEMVMLVRGPSRVPRAEPVGA